ncbi:MAG: PepSY domain-containing protein [Acidimicrobiales bacterium]|nr:PepSY domain-containing protein [Acidimicrobiales bacterium]
MQKRTRIAIAAASVVGAAAVGGGVAVATGVADDDDTQAPITGDELDRATDAALEHTGGGEVTETEKGDEESLYEVEVRLDDGNQVDVQLDEDFQVVSSDPDSDTSEDDD